MGTARYEKARRLAGDMNDLKLAPELTHRGPYRSSATVLPVTQLVRTLSCFCSFMVKVSLKVQPEDITVLEVADAVARNVAPVMVTEYW